MSDSTSSAKRLVTTNVSRHDQSWTSFDVVGLLNWKAELRPADKHRMVELKPSFPMARNVIN